MSDLRELEPPLREITLGWGSGHEFFEIDIVAWPYSSFRSENVISPKIRYRLRCSSFDEAMKFAEVARRTVQAVHDVWLAKVVRVEETRA